MNNTIASRCPYCFIQSLNPITTKVAKYLSSVFECPYLVLMGPVTVTPGAGTVVSAAVVKRLGATVGRAFFFFVKDGFVERHDKSFKFYQYHQAASFTNLGYISLRFSWIKGLHFSNSQVSMGWHIHSQSHEKYRSKDASKTRLVTCRHLAFHSLINTLR